MQNLELPHNVIIGDFHSHIIKVELDNKNRRSAKRIGKILNKRYSLDGFIIFRSSTSTHRIERIDYSKTVFRYRTQGYHIIFNRKVSEMENHSIIAWLCLYLKDENLTKWFLMQCIKQTITLRIGFKGNKKPPEEVYRYGNQDKMIKEFLDNRQFILDFLNGENKNAKTEKT